MSVLTVRNLTMRFGGITAVNRLDLDVQPGQIFSVIGPNGAGKTTVFNAITGIYEPTGGDIRFDGRPLRKPLAWRPAVTALGVGLLTPRTRQRLRPPRALRSDSKPLSPTNEGSHAEAHRHPTDAPFRRDPARRPRRTAPQAQGRRGHKGREALARARAKGVYAGYPLGRDYAGLDDALLVAVTEKRTVEEIDRLVEALA